MTRKKAPPKIEPQEERAPGPETFTHPLMPGNGELPAPKVLRFFVTRKNDRTGAWDFAPGSFGAHDLPSLESLFEIYGGGQYWIRGQDHTGFIAPYGVWNLAGKPKPLAPEPEAAAPAPALSSIPTNAAGGLDMGALLVLVMQGQQAAQAENTKLMGTIITAMLGQRQAAPGETLSEKLLTALVAKGSPNESGQMVREHMAAWKEGLGQGTELAKIAAEAAAAGVGPVEPSGLDKALDTVAPLALGKMVNKVLGDG